MDSIQPEHDNKREWITGYDQQHEWKNIHTRHCFTIPVSIYLLYFISTLAETIVCFISSIL